LPIGTVCVIDNRPRHLSDSEREALESLARLVASQLELRKELATLEVQAMTDGLTGLWNRRAFNRRLSEEWCRLSRSQEPISLLMIDMDAFKRINDDFGHPAGDAVLAQAARIIQQAVRQNDVVARLGGEEFSVVLSDTGLDAALAVAEKVRVALQDASWPHRAVTASIGVASVVPSSKVNPNALVARADRALYAAKQQGRNQVQPFVGWD
jgi:diguanylate cyclase (GGDEF)-like protein